MSSLREALGDSALILGWIARLPPEFAPSRVEKASEEALVRFAELEGRRPDPRTLDDAVSEVRTTWRAEKRIDAISRRTLRVLPWALFHPHARADDWLARESGLVEHFIEWAAKSPRSARRLSQLVTSLLEAWPVDQPGSDVWLAALRAAVVGSTAPRSATLRERCLRYRLLDRSGPAAVASMALGAGESFPQVFFEAGLGGPLEASRFVQACAGHLLDAMDAKLRSGELERETLTRLLSWLAPSRGGRLRFESLRVAMISSLLSPFEDRNPTAPVQQQIRTFLLDRIGDPRIRRHAWAGVPGETLQVILRWLAALSLEDFFRLLDATALDRHWRYRKKFWSAYLERGAITDAWIALGPDAESAAARFLDRSPAAAAKLRKPDIEANHSVLLMKIGGITVAEWSHMGSCRLWREGNAAAPVMYLADYRRPQLVDGFDDRFPHYAPEQGWWQSRVARWIEDQTGIRVAQGEYMLRTVR